MESTADFSLRHAETNHRHTESSLPDCHTVHEPQTYSKRASSIQNEFFKTWFYVFEKKIFKIFFNMQWQNIFTKDYNYFIIVTNVHSMQRQGIY